MDDDDWGLGDEVSGEFVTQSGTDIFTVSGKGNSPTVLVRAIGMYLVGIMPADGLIETITTLREFTEFYGTESPKYLPPPRLEKVRAIISDSTP